MYGMGYLFVWLEACMGVNKRSPLADRFWAKVDKSGECWTWTATKNPTGYGYISDKGKMRIAHRVSYELAHGTLPDHLDVLHTCDNPSCVNPAHLRLGTHQDNMDDMKAKGRYPHRQGESASNARLTWDVVAEIRRRYAQGDITQSKLAQEYGVHYSTISLIVKGIGWNKGA
jgi:DNA-binding XRE family transcriptional regulator